MIARIFRSYKPKIHFKKGLKSNVPVETEEVAKQVEIYQKPQYLSWKKELTNDEIDMLNQGGRPPAINWRKIAPLTDIHSD